MFLVDFAGPAEAQAKSGGDGGFCHAHLGIERRLPFFAIQGAVAILVESLHELPHRKPIADLVGAAASERGQVGRDFVELNLAVAVLVPHFECIIEVGKFVDVLRVADRVG